MRVTRTGVYSGRAFAFLMGTVLVGAFVGSLIYMNMDSDTVGILGRLQADIISDRNGSSLSGVLLKSLGSSTVFLFAVFISGYCAVGQPIAFTALFIKGLGSGVLLSRLYSQYSVTGIAYGAVAVLPGAVFSSAALCLAAREALCLSNTYALFSLSERQVEGIKRSIKLYCAKFLVLEAALAVSAGAEMLIALLSKGFVLK